MDFSFIESFFGDPVVIQGVIIPGIIITLELLLAFYIIANEKTKLKIRMFLYMNKVASFTLIVFISIVIGSANSFIVMHTLPDYYEKPHPFIYYLTTNKEFKNTKIEKLSFKEIKLKFDSIRFNDKELRGKFKCDSLNIIEFKYDCLIRENDMLFFYLHTKDTTLTKEVFEIYNESGKKTFDHIKEFLILKRTEYKKRIIGFEAKTNMYAGLITACIIGLFIIGLTFKRKWIIKLVMFLIVLGILYINFSQYKRNVSSTEPKCVYTSYYNLYLDELVADYSKIHSKGK